jgi:peptidoglycan hydrolase CwlO-like protein
MKRHIIFLVLLISVSISSFAKKDINAWKNENNLKQQYSVFKENLNFWNGSYFLNEKQLDDFYKALTDSISFFKNEVSVKASKVNSLQNELNSTNKQLEDTKVDLEKSIKNQNAIEVFGQNIDKTIYTFIIYMFILALLVLLGILFLLYKRSINVTARTKKEYNELKEEFEVHKKNALERYTKINMELHHTRLKMNKK